MKFTVSSAEFSERLQQVLHVMSSKPITPVFNFVKFDLYGDNLSLTGSDGDITLTASMKVDEPEGEGSFLILGSQISFLSKFGNQPLVFTIDDRSYSLEIKSAAGKYNYIGQSASEYPAARSLAEDAREINLPSDSVMEGINKTLFAASNDELRPIMISVCVDVAPEGLYFVATDAHKLAMVRYNNLGSEDAKRLVWPARSVGALKNFLAKDKGELNIKFDNSSIYFKSANYLLISRLVEGNYPNYKAVIPREMPISVFVNADVFRVALTRVAACSSATNLVRMSITSNNIHLLSQDLDYSVSGEENVECTLNGVESIELGIRSDLMLAILGAISPVSEIELKLIDRTRPMLVLPVNQAEESEVTMLVTPMVI